MCVGNDTYHARRADFSARNRGLPCVQLLWKKWLDHFFHSLKGRPMGASFFHSRTVWMHVYRGLPWEAGQEASSSIFPTSHVTGDTVTAAVFRGQ